MSDFWARKLGGQQAPPHVQQQPVQQGSAWWQTPAHPGIQAPTPPQGYGQPGSGVPQPDHLTYQQLKGMKADQMSQDHMEMLALMELQEQKYNNACPNCGSTNFLPAGVKVGTAKMSTDKCFECGAGARSPEPAVGGGGGKSGRATKQLDGGSGSYGRHHSELPRGYLPT